MALSTDLFVIQSQTDDKLYKLSLNELQAAIEGDSGINFRGLVDLLAPISGQINPEPPSNGDMYIVEQDAPTIDATWTMSGGVTAASQNDRIIWSSIDSNWTLIKDLGDTGGTLTALLGVEPINVDMISDPQQPVVSVDDATATTKGVVARLATTNDVDPTNNTPPTDAVVTADQLNATNKTVETLVLSPGGVVSVSSDDVNNNNALNVSPNSGLVKVEVSTSSDSNYGVVQIADSLAISQGTPGPTAVVDASHLKDAIDDALNNLPQTAINSITEGGTDIVADALDITTDASFDVTIGVKQDVFCTADFTSLADINA